ncbi:MAG: 3-dehydroquinate synthase [bacterium]|jgi:3-dehydroquinate synthase
MEPLKPVTITVGLGERSYEIAVGRGLLDSLGEWAKTLKMHSPIVVITDSNAGPLYAGQVINALQCAGYEGAVLTFPAGEPSKNLNTIARLYDGLVDHRPERRSGIVALGGGVVGDVAGFVASTYLRGIRFIQVPTTLLAQVDASVGGKVGIDHAGGKNLIGSFHQPSAVIIDTNTLRSLDQRQIRAGLAEIIKHGVIADVELFEKVSQTISTLLEVDDDLYAEIIPWNCRIKSEVVEQDEKEQGLRAILNFGHTIGHAVEALTHYTTYLHGEAVAIGMLVEAQLGMRLGITPPDVVHRLWELLVQVGYPLHKPELSTETLIDCMFRDKKVEGGKLRFIFPVEMGKVLIQPVDDLKRIRETWEEYS